MDMILDIVEIEKHFDGVKALSDFSCSLRRGEILGLIGPNGAGKSTLFNIVSGFIKSDCGNIFLEGKEISGLSPHLIVNMGVSRTFQTLRLIRKISVQDNILLSFQNQIGEKFRNIFFNWKQSQEHDISNLEEAILLLEESGLSHKSGDLAEGLSYGQQKILSLVCCLATKSKVILLDEPIAGIAPEMIERILNIILRLPSQGKSIILIEHNIDVITNICDRVVFMDSGMKVCEGTPEQVRNDSRVIESYIN